MPRGGRRTGRVGVAYQQRSDLNRPAPIDAPTGQPYGVRAEQIAAQRAIPIARPATDSVPPATAPRPPATAPPPGRPTGPAMPTGPAPGEVVPLDAPSQRPDEPVTAGLPVGPGAGSEANPFNNVGSPDDGLMALRAAYAAYPSEEIRAMLEAVDVQ